MGFYRYLLVSWAVITTLTVVNASENIALSKATNQSSIYGSFGSLKAVDGCVNTTIESYCCTHTEIGKTEAWWQVYLQTQSVIDIVNIIYRNENTIQRLAGYEIYLSNTQDWTSGKRCHKDTTADKASMSAIQNVQCPGVARYLTIYNDRREKAKTWYSDDATLELCEVQVYGCPVGKYGNGNCNNDCTNCLGDICNPTSGTCDDCAAGYYEVDGSCSHCPVVNCKGNICESATGACSECDVGFYGGFCNQPCPLNCRNNVCNMANGQCTDGCSTGFSGVYCRCQSNCRNTDCPTGKCTDCNDGFYGPVCTKCAVGCSSNACDKTSGHCSQCDGGFYGSFCNHSCPVNCKSNVCYMINGQCVDCNDGYYGAACTPCPVGCSSNTCDKTTGTCLNCNEGYYGLACIPCPVGCSTDTCDKTAGNCFQCEVGSYGNFCNHSCPAYCKNNVCNIDNGQCTECEAGFYGTECNQSCPDNCQDTLCHRSSGECEVCVAGLYGSQCSEFCGNCQGVSCDKDMGDCATGCTDGWTGDTCDTKVVIITNGDALHAAVGIGVGSGVVILALVIVIIVLARRLTMKRGDTAGASRMAAISLSRTANELNKDQGEHLCDDNTYDEITTHNKEQTIAQISHTEANYEQLGRREVEVPHIYNTTDVDKKT